MISIIIPAFNCEKTILNTIESIKKSGINDYEILIVDDGSTDNTASICDGLSASNDNIRCIHQKNAGASAARNTGLKNADGEYVFFFDSDDSVIPNSLEKAEKIINAHNPDMLIFGVNFDYYHKGKLYRRDAMVYPNEGMMILEDIRKNFQELYDCNALTPVWNKIIKKTVLINAKVCFDESMIIMEDFLFVLNALPFCKNVYCLPEAAYCYKQSDDPWFNAYSRFKKVENFSEFIDKIDNALSTIGIENRSDLLSKISSMLLEQKLYFASLKEIKNFLRDYDNSIDSYKFTEQKALSTFIGNKYSRFRYKLAVALRYLQNEFSDVSLPYMQIYKKDLYRYFGNNISLRNRFFVSPELKYLKYFRQYQSATNIFVRKIRTYRLLHYSKKTQIQIPGNTKIGPGFYIGHHGRIIINPEAIIGSNVNIATGVTIGQENRGKRKGSPVIGNNVWIGTNAVIVGKVHIGNDVLIAPLSYVNFDVPDHSIVIGNPAKIIPTENATQNYIENLI